MLSAEPSRFANIVFLSLNLLLPQPNQQPKTTLNNFCWGGIIIGKKKNTTTTTM
jgi:hypothetical protein